MDTKLNLPVLLGTNRKLRKSVFAAHWLLGEMKQQSALAEVFLFNTPLSSPQQPCKF